MHIQVYSLIHSSVYLFNRAIWMLMLLKPSHVQFAHILFIQKRSVLATFKTLLVLCLKKPQKLIFLLSRPLGWLWLGYHINGGGGGGGGGLRSQNQAGYRRSTGPNLSIYQSGFPNNYFGLDAMNNPQKSTSGDTFAYCSQFSITICAVY